MNLPPNVTNDRFASDIYVKFRPALTFVGFDNEGDNRHGFGVKQVLELARDATSRENFLVASLASRATVELWPRHRAGEPDIARTHVANHNSSIVQARCFAALFSLILSENELDLPGIRFLAPEIALKEALDCFLRDAEEYPLFAHEIESGQDRVKWTKSLMNMARAVDLYLALENAMVHYGKDDAALMKEGDKKKMFERLEKAIGDVLNLVDHKLGIGSYISGNWSLKMWVSAAYGCMGMQETKRTNRKQLDEWLGRGIRRAAPGNLQDKRRYWTYMTTRKVGEAYQDRQRTWAEGPYYLHFALQDVIPFWHAIRSQGYLKSKISGIHISDPFHSDWFIRPLDWLADIVTPEGGTPPFDDGNRKDMRYVHLLTWASEYGNEQVSRKMNAIYQTLKELSVPGVPDHLYHVDKDLMLVQLAMPATIEVTPPASEVGNRSAMELEEEQLIARRKVGGRTHYICLHGEGSSDTIERGEGHEQPDQLQLLYYIDDQSLLMDAGYDRGHFIKNSSWNRYTDHNVMAFDDGDSGMKAPHKTLKTVSHTTVNYLHFDPFTRDEVVVMKGHTVLKWRKNKRLFNSGYRNETDGHYSRTVLFINDGKTPYLIDVNQVRWDRRRGIGPSLQMRYHVNGSVCEERGPWHCWGITDGTECTVYFQGVEFDRSTGKLTLDLQDVKERFDEPISIKRFTYYGPPKTSLATLGIFSVMPERSKTSPIPMIPYRRSGALTHQIWTWETISKDILDIILVRSQGDQGKYEEGIVFEVPLSDRAVKFICHSRQDVGFARCQKIRGSWQVLDDFLYGLEVLEDLPV